MKKYLLIIALIAGAPALSAWDRPGHAAINKIAEDHLTPKAAAAVKEYMGGESIVTFASYPDDYRDRLNAGLKLTLDWSRDLERGFAHTFEVDGDLQAFHTFYDESGRHITNGVLMAEHFALDLQDKSLADSLKFIELAMLCHFIGDIHCPTHIRYQPKREICNWKVEFWGEKVSYHAVWDRNYIARFYPWSASDLAMMCDICTEKQIAEIVKGDVYDWAHDSAVKSLPVRENVKKGDVLDRDWCLDHLDLIRSQIRTAGYRLAHQLNMIFDPAYARRHR